MLKVNLKLYPSKPDTRDHIIKAATPLKTKGFADLSQFCTSVKDQGVLGSCTAFASVGAMEFLQKRFGENKADDIYSERFTYYATRVNVLNWTPDDSGAYVRDAVKSLVKYGTCLEKSFPYNGDCKTAPGQPAYAEASKYQALSYAKFEDGNSPVERSQLINVLKANLDAGLPIIGGFICYSNIWSAVKGVIPKSNGQIIGGHAILLVGYDDSKQLFKFKNSWGKGWGDNGYGYLPYDYYILGDMFDLWSIHKSENEDIKSVGLDVVNPNIQKAVNKADLEEALKQVIEQADGLLTRGQTNGILNEMIKKYVKKPKITTLLNALKGPLNSMAS